MIYALVVLAAVAYARGAGVLPLRRIASFIAGLFVVLVALSPWLDRAAHERFSAHMAQHMLLLTVAPPLIVYGRPLFAWMMSLSRSSRRVIARAESRVSRVIDVVAHPAFVWAAYTGVVWVWHFPRLYEAAVVSSGVHVLEHATFFGAGVLVWGTLIGAGTRRRVGYAPALALAFLTMLPSVWLAMILSFAPRAIYDAYPSLADQQLAGAIMWAPMALGSMLTVGALFVRWLRSYEMRLTREA
jgi:putative membrane protein